MSEQLFSGTDNSPDVLGDLLGKILGSQIQVPSEVPSSSNEDTGAINTGSSNNIGSAGGGTGGANPFGDIFSSLLSNPDLILKLPSIISAAKPIIEIFSQSHKSPSDSSAKPAYALPANAKANEGEGKSKTVHLSGREAECRNALLCAMKPYLSSDRQHAIDYIIKLSRLGDILRTL